MEQMLHVAQYNDTRDILNPLRAQNSMKTFVFMQVSHSALMIHYLSLFPELFILAGKYEHESWRFHFLLVHQLSTQYSDNTSIIASYLSKTTMCFNQLMIIRGPFFTNKNRLVNCLIPTFPQLETGSNSNETVHIYLECNIWSNYISMSELY